MFFEEGRLVRVRGGGGLEGGWELDVFGSQMVNWKAGWLNES